MKASNKCVFFLFFFNRLFIFNQLSGQFTNNSASECCRRGAGYQQQPVLSTE